MVPGIRFHLPRSCVASCSLTYRRTALRGAVLDVLVPSFPHSLIPSFPRLPTQKERSPQWRDGKFRNRLERHDGPIWRSFGEFFFGGSKHRRPTPPIPFEPRVAADYATHPGSGLRVTWLGHSTTLLEVGGTRLLFDPVWSERASFVDFAGPKRFFPPPLPRAELPPVDAIVLSHDHYDHLDRGFVESINGGR